MVFTTGSVWSLLIILKPILTLEYYRNYIIEQGSVVKLAEENSDRNNFLFSSRKGECMSRKK